jgi:membrane protease YdiL (CAAX protease family)
MTDLPPPTSAPAGWYPDPEMGALRFFDGYRWVGAPVPPPAPPRGPHPTLPIEVAWGALGVLTASLVVAKVIVDQLLANDWPLIVYIVVAAVVSYGPSLVWVAYVRRRWGGGRLASLGLQFRWSDLGWAPLTWLIAVLTQAGIAVVVYVTDIPFTSNIESDGSGVNAGDERTYVIALLVAAVVAAPVIEELVFRGLVMRGFLGAMPSVVAIGAQGVLFGAAHVDPVRGAGNIGLVLVLSGVGVALGGAAYLLRRLGASVLAHAILNGVVLALVLTGALDGVESPFELLLGR